MSAHDPRSLIGEWKFDRVVRDHLAGEVLAVAGRITFEVQDDGDIRWSESGTMTRAGVQIPVTRVLFLRQDTEGWRVTFDDGRDFHPWQPGSQVEHLCGRDTYRGLVSLDARDVAGSTDGAGEWSIIWQATGPAKDYEMVTRLRPS